MSAEINKSLAERFDDAPERFDPDMARHILTTLANDAPASLEMGEISNPTNRFQPTLFSKDRSRAGANRVTANYLGLIGPVAALPASYTDAAIAERKRRSSSLFDFFELFAGQLREMFVDAHRKYRLPSLFQLYRTGAQNRITSAVFALIGFAQPNMRERLEVNEEIPLYYAGFFANQRRTAVNLRLMLRDFLGLPVEVQQFQLRRLPIAEDEQTRLGMRLDSNAALGRTAVAGATSLNRTSAIRIRIGPVDYPRYLSLMPDRPLYPKVVELIRLYCGPSLNFDLQIVLSKSEIPQTQLDAKSPVGRLGWDTWALQGAAAEDSEDTIFDPDVVSARAVS
ncbi:hypothetical protein MAUB1S_06364 [Mycolicibacterium aubagnense]